MKKILSILLVLVMCLGVFVACGEPEPIDFSAAKTTVFNLYNGKLNSTKDYDVVGKTIVADVTYDVTWASSDSAITVKASSKAGFWTIDLPDSNEVEKTYTLTATISAEGQSTTLELSATLPKYSALQGDTSGAIEVGKAYTIGYKHDGTNKQYYINGYLSGYYLGTTETITDAVNFYFEEATDGYNLSYVLAGTKYYLNMVVNGNFVNPSTYDTTPSTVYNYDEDLGTIYAMVGNDAYTIGVRTDTNDDGEYYTTVGPVLVSQASEKYIIALFDSANADQAGDGLTTPAEIVNGAYALAEGAQLNGIYTLTGVITSIDESYSSQYKNITLNMVVDGMTDKPIKCYRMKGTGADVIAVGDTITVVGVIKNYKGTIEFDSGCILKSYVEGEGGNEPTPAPEVTPVEPVVGNKYNLVLVKGGNNYVNGAMAATYYFGTTTTVADGVNFYVEETTGGYYLYGIVAGEKLYVNFIVNDPHVNAVYEATASTVYTYDATVKTFKTSINDGEYALGVSTSKTFTTVGPVDITASNDYAVFVASTNSDQTASGGDDSGNQGDSTGGSASALEIGKGYTISATNGKGKIYVISTIASGRFQGTYTEADATVFYVEAAATAGNYLLYYMDGTTKTYVVFEDSTTGASVTTDSTAATEFEWNTDKNTLAVAEDSNNRAFAVGATATYDNFSAYDLSGTYNWGQYTSVDGDVVGGDTTDDDDNTGTQPENPYTAATELKNGDVVMIVADAYKMALSADKVDSSSFYNKGVDYSNGFDAITDAELFVVTVNGDGSYTFTSKSGKVIALADSYASLNDTGANASWSLEAKDGAAGVFYVKNTVRGNYLEWYASKNNWSTYSPSSLSDLFELSFFVVEAAQ